MCYNNGYLARLFCYTEVLRALLLSLLFGMLLGVLLKPVYLARLLSDEALRKTSKQEYTYIGPVSRQIKRHLAIEYYEAAHATIIHRVILKLL